MAEEGFVLNCLKQPITHESVDLHQKHIPLPFPLRGAIRSSYACGGGNLVLDVLRVEFCLQFFYGLGEIAVGLHPSVLRRVVWWHVCSSAHMSCSVSTKKLE